VITEPKIVAHTINSTLPDAHDQGFIEPNIKGDLTPGVLFPFNISEIISMHTSRKGTGVWFRQINYFS